MFFASSSKKSKLVNLNGLLALTISLAYLVTFTVPARAQSLQTTQSSLAILTDKEGLASGLAHRHIIVASKWNGTVQIKYQGNKPSDTITEIESGSAKIVIPVNDLIVDSPDAAKGIIDLLSKAQFWDLKKDKLEPSSSDSVRENMLAESQLNAAKFAKIEGSGKFNSCQKTAESQLQCLMELTVTVREKTVVKNIPVNIIENGNSLTAEFLGSFKFSEFGIKAYTALLGAIAVKDDFVLAASLVATK